MPPEGPESPEHRAIIERLRGTCLSLFEVGAPEDDPAFDALLDSELRLCETCGWWEETAMVDEEGNCEQCWEEEEDL